MKIPIGKIKTFQREDGDPLNPRGQVRNSGDLQSSFSAVGQQSPVRVVERDGEYYLLAGHRRLIAARELGWTKIDAEITQLPDDSEQAIFEAMLADNVRVDLDPLQKAHALKRLLEYGRPLVQAAELMGLRIRYAEIMLSILDQDESIQQRFRQGDLTVTAWEAIRDAPPEARQRLAALDKPTVRAARRLAKEAREESEESGDAGFSFTTDSVAVVEFRAAANKIAATWSMLPEEDRDMITEELEKLALIAGVANGGIND